MLEGKGGTSALAQHRRRGRTGTRLYAENGDSRYLETCSAGVVLTMEGLSWPFLSVDESVSWWMWREMESFTSSRGKLWLSPPPGCVRTTSLYPHRIAVDQTLLLLLRLAQKHCGMCYRLWAYLMMVLG